MFREFLKRFRMRHKIKQKDLAKELSIPPSKLSLIETGRISCPLSLVEVFKSAFQFILSDSEYQEIYQCVVEMEKNKEKKPAYDNSFFVNFRQAHGLAQKEVAQQTNYTIGYINAIETGTFPMSLIFYKKFYAVYGNLFTEKERKDYDSYTGIDLSKNIKDEVLCQSVGNALIKIRLNRKLTLKEQAETLGVCPSYLSQLEHEKIKLSYQFLDTLMKKYELTEEEKEELFSVVSKELPDCTSKIIQNFVVTNELETLLMNLETIRLSKEEVHSIFKNVLEQAKILKKAK